jgi:hypothetical protein
MTFSPDPKYPSRRAYVVKFRGDSTPHVLAGRIENLVTGRQLEFASGDELLDSIARDFLDHVNEPSASLKGFER